LIGNLTRDPELRYVPSGTAVASFSIAVNKTYVSNGEKKEEVSFIKVNAWGKVAEMVGEYLTKGRAVLVSGSLKQERWETEDGKQRDKTLVNAVSVQFLGAKPEPREEDPRQDDDVAEIDVDVNDVSSDIPF
jgi:single-strand DNA-binding protein